MRKPSLPTLLALVTCVLGMTAGAWAGDRDIPRTSWGAPDLDGLWDFRTLTPFQRPAELADKKVLSRDEADALRKQTIAALDVDNRADQAAVDIEGAYNNTWYDWGTRLTDDLRTSLIVDPPDGRLPALTASARSELRATNRKRTPPVRDMFSFSAGPATFRPAGPESLGLSERCLVGFNAGPPLTPSAYNNNLRIVQTPEHVLLVTEMIHNARVVQLDGRPHLPSPLRLWSGDARGYWEGDTLVVVTTNFTDKTPTFQLPATTANLDEAGAVGSSDKLRLVERFTRTAQDGLLYEYTIDDAATFTKPFTVAIPMRRAEGYMFEYACHEGNYAVPGMLKGARLLDAEAG